MNDFLTKIKELCNSTVVYWILVGVTVFGVCYGASWLKNRYNSGTSAAADVVADQIESAREHQRGISGSLSDVKERTGDLSERIEGSKNRIERAQVSVDDIGRALEKQRELIRECKRIVSDIQERDTKETSEN